MKELTKFRDDIKAKVEEEEKKGYKPKPDVLEWIENVHKLENEWETMQEECILPSEVSTQARNIRDQLSRLIQVRENFGSNLVVEIYRMKKVEHIPAPSIIEGQSIAATRNLNENEILRLLEDDKSWHGGSAPCPLSKRSGVRSPPLANGANSVTSSYRLVHR
ncbi:hypothetical protein BC332_20296 [Capsicum chinense]|nr:hypothetical protein BC332_20296 [Capsicum chinense]